MYLQHFPCFKASQETRFQPETKASIVDELKGATYYVDLTIPAQWIPLFILSGVKSKKHMTVVKAYGPGGVGVIQLASKLLTKPEEA